jgi:hypothetical protein
LSLVIDLYLNFDAARCRLWRPAGCQENGRQQKNMDGLTVVLSSHCWSTTALV